MEVVSVRVGSTYRADRKGFRFGRFLRYRPSPNLFVMVRDPSGARFRHIRKPVPWHRGISPYHYCRCWNYPICPTSVGPDHVFTQGLIVQVSFHKRLQLLRGIRSQLLWPKRCGFSYGLRLSPPGCAAFRALTPSLRSGLSLHLAPKDPDGQPSWSNLRFSHREFFSLSAIGSRQAP